MQRSLRTCRLPFLISCPTSPEAFIENLATDYIGVKLRSITSSRWSASPARSPSVS